MKAKDDTWKWILGRGRAVSRDANGIALRIVGTNIDITERVIAEEDLKIAKARLQELLLDRTILMEDAQRASRAKSMFLATMSHELRTPLNSIIGFTELVSTCAFCPIGDQHYIEHSEYANQSAQHLLGMINEMLDLSKIEAGTMKLEQMRVSVRDCITRSIRMVDNMAQKAGIAMKVVMPDAISDLWADERAVRHILTNLLTNAIKFNTADGSIIAEVLEDGQFIEIVVSDTGVGIPDDAIGKVFMPFEQVRNEYNRAHGGTGLGLAIVDGLIKLHGGTVTVASEVGKGTSFTVRLPAFTG